MDKGELIYSILKGIQSGPEPKQEDYSLDKEQWGVLLEFIQNEGYAKDITVSRGGRGNKVLVTWLNTAKLTSKGEAYLKTHS